MGCVWGVVIGPQEQLLSIVQHFVGWSKKCLGGSRRVLGVPQTPLLGIMGQGAGAGTPWARGLGAPGPKIWDTRRECNYLLSGKLPTIRQATYYQASYLLSGRLSAVMKLATYYQADYLLSGKLPTVRQAISRYETCTQQPHTLHPNV